MRRSRLWTTKSRGSATSDEGIPNVSTGLCKRDEEARAGRAHAHDILHEYEETCEKLEVWADHDPGSDPASLGNL
ncbi:MAG: hypothetical protein ACRDOP_10865, partial [Gaiellaceae bacterium]